MFLSEYADLADDDAFREAMGRYQFFPSPMRLKELFEERKRSNVVRFRQKAAAEFVPPHELREEFASLQDAIGAAAFSSWFRGAEAWKRTDGGVTIRAGSPLFARWIRENYAPALESACGAHVEVTY